MYRHHTFVFIAISQLFVLAGCTPELKTSLYVQDVIAAAGGAKVETSAEVRIPQSSKSRCSEDLPTLEEAIRSEAEIVGEPRCISEGLNDFAAIRVRISVMPAAMLDSASGILSIGVMQDGTRGYRVSAKMRKSVAALTEVVRQRSDTYAYIPEVDVPLFEIGVENDFTGSVMFAAEHGFVNGSPKFGSDVEIERRDSMQLVLSNVSSSALASGTTVNVGWLSGFGDPIVSSELIESSLYDSRDDVVIGNIDGNRKLVVFFDFNDKYGRRAATEIRQLINADSDLRVILKSFPILSKESVESARVGLGVAAQGGNFLEYYEAMSQFDGEINADVALNIAKEMGYDIDQIKSYAAADESNESIERTYELARELSLTGVPTYVVNDKIIAGDVGKDVLEEKLAIVR